MKTVIITITLTIYSLFMNAQTSVVNTSEKTGISITVNVPVQSSEGSVLFALQDENTFMRGGLASLESKIVDGKATVTFENVTPGIYAVILFHDKNGNKQMDFESNGMPIEMYGVSNNVMNMGPPQWGDAKFEVANEPIVLDIRM